jgi:hypothetical protein
LSNQIDLQSTLIRAEALFNRFQRAVEAVDRKNNFPIPSNVRQRRPGSGSPQPSQDGNVASTTGAASRATPALLGKPARAHEGTTAPESSSSTIAAGDTRPVSAGKGKRKSSEVAAAGGEAAEQTPTEKKVISQELRDLLKKDIFYKLDKKEVKKHGGGVGS